MIQHLQHDRAILKDRTLAISLGLTHRRGVEKDVRSRKR